MVINIGKGKAGISEVGNEMEDVRFYGGDYGIMAGPTSPSWPVMLEDTYFEGQRKAAILLHNTGWAAYPISIAFGDVDGNTLFVTTRTSLYGIRVK